MRLFRPNYVGAFKCDGAACNARCCRNWRVSVDEETRDKFLRLPSADRQKFFQHLDDSAQAFRLQEAGACPFLDENFLCKLQLEYGEEFLPAICHSFPRVTYKLAEDIFLQAMTLTCPLAAKLLLRRNEPPLTFEVVEDVQARLVFDFTEKIPLPAEIFLARQKSAIEILQRRDLSLNARLETLCAFFDVKGSSDFDEANHALTLAEIFNATYDANMSSEKIQRLATIYLTQRGNVLSELRGHFATVLENYLVNEFVMRCYPCAFAGDERFNCRVFVTVYRAVEFAAVLTAIAKERLNAEDFTEMLCALSDKLDHGRGGMDAIKAFAARAEDFYSTMIER